MSETYNNNHQTIEAGAAEDRLLAEQLAQGGEMAYAAVFNRYNRLLYVLAYRYLRSREQAEDAVQHTFMRLWERRQQLDFAQGVRSLLVTIMKNHILNELRHQQVVVEHRLQVSRQSEPEDDFIGRMESDEERRRLMAAIEQLPEQKRRICQLKFDGMTNKEIAEQLGIAVPTVKSHYTMALVQLKTIINKSLLILLLL